MHILASIEYASIRRLQKSRRDISTLIKVISRYIYIVALLITLLTKSYDPLSTLNPGGCGGQPTAGQRLATPKKQPRTPRVQVPNNHILSKILTYITTILKPSTELLGPLDPWGKYCMSEKTNLPDPWPSPHPRPQALKCLIWELPKIGGTLFWGPENKEDPTI